MNNKESFIKWVTDEMAEDNSLKSVMYVLGAIHAAERFNVLTIGEADKLKCDLGILPNRG